MRHPFAFRVVLGAVVIPALLPAWTAAAVKVDATVSRSPGDKYSARSAITVLRVTATDDAGDDVRWASHPSGSVVSDPRGVIAGEGCTQRDAGVASCGRPSDATTPMWVSVQLGAGNDHIVGAAEETTSVEVHAGAGDDTLDMSGLVGGATAVTTIDKTTVIINGAASIEQAAHLASGLEAQ